MVSVLRRELSGYFTTPVAYVFIVVYLVLAGALTFQVGGFYERGQADLSPFFTFHPWLYLFLVPAIAMRLWAEERRTGTIELLLTLPIPTWAAVVGKYLAAWGFVGIALVLTFPIWITAAYLGEPDHGVILAGYVGSFVMAGGFLAIGSCVSSLTKSQVIAFVLSVVVCFVFLLAGQNSVISFLRGWAPPIIIETVSGFSFLTHFDSISKGVIDLRDLVFFGSLIALALVLNTVLVDARKGS